jgi:hypothetical protein
VMMTWKGLPMSIMGVRYRIEKSNRAGVTNIKLRKVMGPKRRYVDAVAKHEAERLCNLWKSLHL